MKRKKLLNLTAALIVALPAIIIMSIYHSIAIAYDPAFSRGDMISHTTPTPYVTSSRFTPTTSHMTPTIMVVSKQWLANQLAERFIKSGLQFNRVAKVKEADYIPDTLKFKECLKFQMATMDRLLGGCVITFDSVEDLNKLKEHYLALNEKGEFHTWSFSKDNVLVILSGELSEEQARSYEASLYSI
ncbi:MAG: hypothetical protein HY807_10215 [Nitrospirae bacterium]|nr:hypothetical protein [Nitrospirota bacterium]